MKLKVYGWALLTALATLPHSALAAKPLVANAGTISPAYARDLRVIIEATQMYETLIESPLRSDMAPVQREFIECFRKEATREELVRRWTPSLAAVIPPQLASQVARQAEMPVFMKQMTLIRHKQDEPGNYTEQENAELLRINNDPAIKAFNALLPKVQTSLIDMYKRWSADFNKQLGARSAAIFEKLEQDLDAAMEAKDGRIITVGSTGYAPVDDYNNAVAASYILIANAMAQFEGAQTQLSYDDYFSMRALLDNTRRGEANRVIDQVEKAWDNTKSQYDAALQDFDANLNNSLVTFIGLKQRVSKQCTALRKYFGSQNIIMRRQFALHREMVTFMETNHDGIRVEDEVLIFADKEALRRADELVEKIVATARELDEVQARTEAALHGDLTAPPPPRKRSK